VTDPEAKPVYALNLFDVADRDEYLAYARRSPREVERHGGRVIALGELTDAIVGEIEPRQVLILVEWQSRAHFDSYREDPELGARLADLLGVMDCFVLASTRTEGVPQSLLQAFAAGVPVVASDVGGVPEVVADGDTGILVRAGSALDLERGIEAVLSDRGAAERRARAARALVEARFSHHATMTRLLDLYGGLLGARAGVGWAR